MAVPSEPGERFIHHSPPCREYTSPVNWGTTFLKIFKTGALIVILMLINFNLASLQQCLAANMPSKIAFAPRNSGKFGSLKEIGHRCVEFNFTASRLRLHFCPPGNAVFSDPYIGLFFTERDPDSFIVMWRLRAFEFAEWAETCLISPAPSSHSCLTHLRRDYRSPHPPKPSITFPGNECEEYTAHNHRIILCTPAQGSPIRRLSVDGLLFTPWETGELARLLGTRWPPTNRT